MDRPGAGARPRERLEASAVGRLGVACMRSFFPLVTLGIVLGTVLWGPMVSLLLAIGMWYFVDKLEA